MPENRDGILLLTGGRSPDETECFASCSAPAEFDVLSLSQPANLESAPLELECGQFSAKHLADALAILSPGPTDDESDDPEEVRTIVLVVTPYHPTPDLVKLIKKELKPFRPRTKRNKNQPRGKSA
jgi:hypothetical protein